MLSTRIRSSIFRALFICALTILAFSGTAHAWWNSDWTIRKKITIDTSSAGVAIDGNIGTAPVLVRLHDGNFQFDAAKDDASDLRFVAADDKTLLSFHIEKIDSVMNDAFVWVKVPDLKPGGQTAFYMYYGNNGQDAASVQDAKGTYDTSTTLVYHFGESGAPFADSSGNNNASKAAGTVADALIGQGLRLNGKSSVTVPASPSLQVFPGGALTISAWVKPSALAANQVLFSRHDGAGGLVIGVDKGVPFVEVTGAGGTQRTGPGAAFDANSWHLVTVVGAPGKVALYVDGDAYGAPVSASLPALNSDIILGADPSNAARPGFTGDVDELQISKVARADGYVKFAAVSEAGNDVADKLVAMGGDEQKTGWLDGNSTFGILIKSLTPDGWAVIFILAIMAIASWSIMFSKGSFLNKNARGSKRFEAAWRHVAKDLTVIDADAEHAHSLGGRVDKKGLKELRSTCIYRLYHAGVEEIQHRVSAADSGRVLSAQSIQAIRAALDGVMTRETQKLNNLIVFLTIAISGGPFLGLLGTVVGVMITFASIAKAGDVNVNAIAPGIAAALLATVAGLAVAIPALFGYNYLIARIKEATTDMHVFVDEFVTKLAEYYRPRVEAPHSSASSSSH